LAGTVTAGAVINIQTAAAETGIPAERIIDILESVPYTVTWDDGTAATVAADLEEALRQAFIYRGLYDEKAAEFIAKIVALDTGILGAISTPNLSGMTSAAAQTAILDAGLTVGTITGASGTVSVQDPLSAANAEPRESVDFTIA
jgi:hypothetical protein